MRMSAWFQRSIWFRERHSACSTALVSTQLALHREPAGPKTRVMGSRHKPRNMHLDRGPIGIELALEGGESGYFAYAISNPLSRSDPSGLCQFGPRGDCISGIDDCGDPCDWTGYCINGCD